MDFFCVFAIGQGAEVCFISHPQAKLYSFVLPVALLLVFNLLALGHTVSHILKTRKVYVNLFNLFYFDPLVEKHEWIAPLLYKEISGGILNLTIL